MELEKAYLSAISEDDFYRRLHDAKLEIYFRNEKPTGVTLNRKYRFSTLGFTLIKLKKLEKEFSLSQREKELEEMRQEQQKREKERER